MKIKYFLFIMFFVWKLLIKKGLVEAELIDFPREKLSVSRKRPQAQSIRYF